jgi:hypothetical protein
MRITTSIRGAAGDLLRQRAFTTKAYAAQTPVIWQHMFLSDKKMTNWSGGSPVFFAWVASSKVTRKQRGRDHGTVPVRTQRSKKGLPLARRSGPTPIPRELENAVRQAQGTAQSRHRANGRWPVGHYRQPHRPLHPRRMRSLLRRRRLRCKLNGKRSSASQIVP